MWLEVTRQTIRYALELGPKAIFYLKKTKYYPQKKRQALADWENNPIV